MTASLCANVAVYTGHHEQGYFMLSKGKFIHINGTSTMSCLQVMPPLLLVYGLSSTENALVCNYAQKVQEKQLTDFLHPTSLHYLKL
jgi:hypothetical protein